MTGGIELYRSGLLFGALLLGFVFVLPFKVTPRTETAVPRLEQLLKMFEASENERKLLQREVYELRREVSAYEHDVLSGKSSLEKIQAKHVQISSLAGFTPVRGPGVEIKLSDADTSVIDIGPGAIGVDELVIHDQDIMLLLNELKAAGAEAISIKSGSVEERVVNSTFVRCTGPTLIVNNRKMTSPFYVRAIGDPSVITSALEMTGGLFDQLRVFGIDVVITKKENMIIPAYGGSRMFTFAEPVVEEPEEFQDEEVEEDEEE